MVTFGVHVAPQDLAHALRSTPVTRAISDVLAVASDGVAPLLRVTATQHARELAWPLATVMVYSLGIRVPFNDLIRVHFEGPTLGSTKRARSSKGSGPALGRRSASHEPATGKR